MMNEENDIEGVAPWLIIFITLVGGWLRVLLLDQKGLWLDETFSIWLAKQNLANMLQWITTIDQHPPLYYLLLHYWIALKGDAPYTVRLLSALFGAGTIPVIYLIGKRMSGTVMGLAAAILLAVSPFHIYYAQETRMYTILTFNAAIAIYALVRLLTDPRAAQPIGGQFREYWHAFRNPAFVETAAQKEFSYKDQSPRRAGWRGWISRHGWLPIERIETDLAWVALMVFSAATMLSHNTAVLFPFATNIFVLGLMLYQKIKRSGQMPALQAPSFVNWVKAQVGTFLLWSPWLMAFIRQTRSVYQEFWLPKPEWDTVVQAVKSLLNDFMPDQAIQAKMIWWLYALVLGLGLVHYRKKFTRFLFLSALFAIPWLAELIISLRRPIFYEKTLIWTAIPLFLILGAGIVQLKSRFLIAVVLGILGANSLFSASDYYRYYPKEDWGQAAGYVANNVQKDDLILFNASWVQVAFDYYFEPYETLYNLQVEKHGAPFDLFEGGMLEPKMTASDIPRLKSLLSGRERAWLVYSHNWYTDPTGIIPQTLETEMRLVATREFYGGQVQLYTSP
ncbi:MAG: glycosyltransferase family 39 protein [Anaerolineales bacterium]|jgi:hypothetical protein|nr:glycosyltransferase family 39 protein [Anaerolineales bacterium]